MGEVINIKQEDRNSPEVCHLSGPCRCLVCGHKWMGVAPVGTVSRLECPSCGGEHGFFEVPPGLQDGTSRFVCNCGCDNFYILQDGYCCVRCAWETPLKAV